MVVFFLIVISMTMLLGFGCSKAIEPPKKPLPPTEMPSQLAHSPDTKTPVTHTPTTTQATTVSAEASKHRSEKSEKVKEKTLVFKGLKMKTSSGETVRTNLETLDEDNPLNDKNVQAKLRIGTPTATSIEKTPEKMQSKEKTEMQTQGNTINTMRTKEMSQTVGTTAATTTGMTGMSACDRSTEKTTASNLRPVI